MPASYNDQRRHDRFGQHVPAWLEFHDEHVPWDITTLNLSVEGAAFETESPVNAATPVLLEIQLPQHWNTLECKGKVCWTRETSDGTHRFGVRFVDLSDDERINISQSLVTGLSGPRSYSN